MKNSMWLRNHSHRVFIFSNMQIFVFSFPEERIAVTAGGDLRGLGYVTNKHFKGFYCNGKSSKIRNLTEDCIAYG